MGKIKRDFILKEFRRLAFFAVGFIICIFVLFKCYSGFSLIQKPLVLVVIAILVLSILRSAAQVYLSMRDFNDNDSYLLEKEYAAPHPVYKIWQGEIHLMQNFIVCRNRGRLFVIIIHQIEKAERYFNIIGMRKIPVVKFIMDTDRSVSIGFLLNHPDDGEAVFEWLMNRLGEEKVIN